MQMLGSAQDVPQSSKPKPDAYREIKEGNVAPIDDDSVPF